MDRKPLCIVTGLSGSGKSTALRAFEDLGYFAVDGLPASLAPEIAAMMAKPEMLHFGGLAICMDMREANFLQEFDAVLPQLASLDSDLKLIFLEASDDSLLRRYASTRRPHPLERSGVGLKGAVELERCQLAPLRERADLVLDSSDCSIHDLRRKIHSHFGARNSSSGLPAITVISFGYKYGIPADSDFVFDLRFLDNPFFVDRLKAYSGLDRAVAAYVFQSGAAERFLELLAKLLRFVLVEMAGEGRKRVTFAFGCTGGRHRSVAVAERFAHMERQAGYHVVLEHRNIASEQKNA